MNPLANSAWQGWTISVYYTPSTEEYFSGQPISNGYTVFTDDTIELPSIHCRWYEGESLDYFDFEKKIFKTGDFEFTFEEAKISTKDEYIAEKQATEYANDYFFRDAVEEQTDQYIDLSLFDFFEEQKNEYESQ